MSGSYCNYPLIVASSKYLLYFFHWYRFLGSLLLCAGAMFGISPAFWAIVTIVPMRRCCRIHNPVMRLGNIQPSLRTYCFKISTSVCFMFRPRVHSGQNIDSPLSAPQTGLAPSTFWTRNLALGCSDTVAPISNVPAADLDSITGMEAQYYIGINSRRFHLLSLTLLIDDKLMDRTPWYALLPAINPHRIAFIAKKYKS